MKFLNGKFKALIVILILIVVRWIGSWVGRKGSFYITSQISREQVCGLFDSQQSHCFLQCTLQETLCQVTMTVKGQFWERTPLLLRGWLLRECWPCPMGKLWHWFCNSFSNHESFLYLIIFLRVIVTVILESH